MIIVLTETIKLIKYNYTLIYTNYCKNDGRRTHISVRWMLDTRQNYN